LFVDPASCIHAIMTVVTCKLPKKLAAKLERVAKAERRSKQTLLREAIEQRLKTKRPRGPVMAYDLVKHLCGSIKDGPSDLATNPKYMKGFGE
jgi:predicted DNA-binding protein